MPTPVDQQGIYVAIWAKAVDTQMHFNEMAVKSRQFGLGFVAAALGLGIVLFARREEFTIPVYIFGAQSAGTISSFAPGMGKTKQAAQELKTLFDRKPKIDSWSEEGEPVNYIDGTIEFRDVHFRYPTRPEQPVLRGLNLTVKPGQYVALVGASGCGKSTAIALLGRFYDPLIGGIYVDGKEISSLKINDYRSSSRLLANLVPGHNPREYFARHQ